MRVRLVIDVDLEFRGGGKFAGREELEELLVTELEGADPGEVTTDTDATYEVVGFSVAPEWIGR